MAAADIPVNSVMTETMITDWQSRYGRTRAQTISDLDDIENARAEMPEGLPGSTWADMYASYQGNLARRTSGSPRVKTGIIAGVVGAATSAIVAASLIISGASSIGGGSTAARYVASSTTGISLAASSTVVISSGNASSTLDMRSLPLTGGRGTCMMVTDTASTSPRSYFASWVNGAYTTSTHDCSQ